jgi:nicotinate-nucleotide adenylyltransferase
MRHIGLFGGTFNPIHHGHLLAAVSVRTQLNLDEIRFVPAAYSPFKSRPEVSDTHRIEMLKLVIKDDPALKIDTRELQRPGPSYTIDTLVDIAREQPEDRLYLLIGMDAWCQFEDWQRWQEIIKLCHLVVLSRPGFCFSELPEHWQKRRAKDIRDLKNASAGKLIFVTVPACDAASNIIREKILQGNSTEGELTGSTRRYIERHQLYRDLSITQMTS